MLIVFSGLPGTGKTTIARELACRIGAVYLRIDVIEQALRDAGMLPGASGYGVANALALSNLTVGHTVIADCVNPVRESGLLRRPGTPTPCRDPGERHSRAHATHLAIGSGP
jgi:predicted kinase